MLRSLTRQGLDSLSGCFATLTRGWSVHNFVMIALAGDPMFFVKGLDGFSSRFLRHCFWARVGGGRCVPTSCQPVACQALFRGCRVCVWRRSGLGCGGCLRRVFGRSSPV